PHSQTHPSHAHNARTTEVPPPPTTDQNVDDGHAPLFEQARHSFCPLSQGQRVITTKVGHRKLPPNVLFIPIDDISFHSEKCVFKWKYVVRRRIADESVIFNQYYSYAAVFDLIDKAGMICTVTNLGIFYPKLVWKFIINLPTNFNEPGTPNSRNVHVCGKCILVSPTLLNNYLNTSIPASPAVVLPTSKQLVLELSSGLVRTWPTDGQFFVTKLSMKYAILYNIGVVNGYPSTHLATIFTALAQLVYLISTGKPVDVGEFIFQQIVRHVDTYGINILICFPQLITGFLLFQHSRLLADDDVAGPTPRTITINYKLF
uniref:Putative plant transposon protein domain-containing protein n=1 Tax=Cucumis melo TaxID=3656 RepID=A0A9I9E165_CUCME